MAFAEAGGANTLISVRVGRQELAFGEQRLIGPSNWSNTARTFDAGRITFRTKALSVDAFGASIVRVLDNAADRSGNGNRFAGTYATTTKLIPKTTVDQYVLVRRDTNLRTESASAGDLTQATVGVRFAGKLPTGFDYGVEMALQRGSLGADDVKAWAGHWQLRAPLAGRGAMKLTGEYNYASGDRNPADDVRGTFDQLYPTTHDRYGLADQIGWRNIHHARAGLEVTPWKGRPISTSYHSWRVAERGDAVYATGSAPLARVAGGASASHIGNEIDVQATRALTPYVQLAAGYAHIFPGPFLKQATPGAAYSSAFVTVNYAFSGDR